VIEGDERRVSRVRVTLHRTPFPEQATEEENGETVPPPETQA